MHSHVDAAIMQLFFQLPGEQALAANLCQRAVLDLVPGCGNHNDLDDIGIETMGSHQPVAGFVCLGEGKRRTARANTYRVHLA
jgi:hypothetical protein